MAFRSQIGNSCRLTSSRQRNLYRGVTTLLLGVVFLTVIMTWLSRAAGGADSGVARSTPDDLYARAAAQEQVPLELLVAIVGTESGYHPWALNIDGREVYCHSRQEAEQRLATGDHVAIGLMQISWPYWGQRLGLSKAQMLDPATNLRYGARILRQGLSRSGSIWLRISNYHSGSLETRDTYNRRVYANYLRYLRGDLGR